MDRSRVNNNRLDGFWNPPPPPSPAIKSPNNGKISFKIRNDSKIAIKSEVKPELALSSSGGRSVQKAENLQRLSVSYSSYCSDPADADFGELEKQLTKKMGTQEKWRPLEAQQQEYNAEVISIDDSDDEDAASLRSLESTEPVSMEYEQQSGPVSATLQPSSTSSLSDNDWISKVIDCKTKFHSLRFLYDKQKQEITELKMALKVKDKEMRIMKLRKEPTAEVIRLQKELAARDAQIQQMHASIDAYKSVQTPRSGAVEELLNQKNINQRLTKQNEELQTALKDVFSNQIASFNYHKQRMEKSNETYKLIFRNSKPDEIQQIKGTSFNQSEVTTITASTNTRRTPASDDSWPRDPRLARK